MVVVVVSVGGVFVVVVTLSVGIVVFMVVIMRADIEVEVVAIVEVLLEAQLSKSKKNAIDRLIRNRNAGLLHWFMFFSNHL